MAARPALGIHSFPLLCVAISAFILAMPWVLRRRLLNAIFGYEIDPKAKIGFSIVVPRLLVMHAGAVIGNLNFIRRQDLVLLEKAAVLGHLNSIGGYGRVANGSFEDKPRFPSLILRQHAAVTSRHLFDCTDQIEIGEYSLIAGYRSQFITHAPRLSVPVQACAPIKIGNRVFVGTAVIMLKGATVPDFVVISAGSMVKGVLSQQYMLYEGVPARAIQPLSSDYGFFTRAVGAIA